MGNFVIDNSVVMTWCFKDEANPYASAILDTLTGAQALAPAIWPLEVVNVLLVAERRQRLQEADSSRFLSLLSQLPIQVDTDQPDFARERLLLLGRAHHLSSYDAAYLELAMRKDIPLATLDRRLTTAAGATGVRLMQL